MPGILSKDKDILSEMKDIYPILYMLCI